MLQTQATIVEKQSLAPAWWQLTLEAPALAASLSPGQFLLVRCGPQATCYLRRPVFPGRVDLRRFSLLLRPAPDPGLAWLLGRQPGDALDLIGPLGSGFDAPRTINHLLLVSDSQQLDPLLDQMRRALADGVSVTLALAGPRAAALYPINTLPPAVEVYTATLDGSAGHHGPITALTPDLLRWADRVCAVGSAGLYQTLRTQVEQVRLGLSNDFLYGLVTNHLLGCGVGACFGCTIATTAGLKLRCVDGPVFDLTTLGPEL